MGITDSEYALTVEEMHDAGYIEGDQYKKFEQSLFNVHQA